jgi:hypothetical protein
MTHKLVAVAAKMDLVNLAGLITHGGRSCHALQRFWTGKHGSIRTNFSKEAWAEFFTHSWQRAIKGAVGMLGEQALDLITISIELTFQGPQQSNQG